MSTTETETETKKIERVDGSHLVACYPEDYDRLFLEKQDRLKSLLNWDKEIDAFASPTEHFRMRANFQMWHDDPKNKTPEGFYYAMFDEKQKNKPYEVKNFPRGTKRINSLMSELREVIDTDNVIFENLFEVRFLTTKSKKDEALIVLLYKRPLHKDWEAHAISLGKKLRVKVIGRARKEMVVAGGSDEYIEEELEVKGKPFKLFQTEGAFSQPNATVCEKMITWALDQSQDSKDKDLLELYCGGGTFTAPFSMNFRKVLATEISKPSVDLARRCFKENKIDNITVIRLSSEEFTQFYTNKKTNFKELKQTQIKIEDFDFSTVFVDPPRAGCDLLTCQLMSEFDKIIYISCNPETLARDAEILKKTHDLIRVAAFDQFPYTHHLEAGAVFIKKQQKPEDEKVENEEPALKKVKQE